MDKLQNVGAVTAPAPIEKRQVDPASPERPATAPRENPHIAPESGEKQAPVSLTREQLAETTARLQEALAESRPEDWRGGSHEDDTTGSLVIEIRDADGELIKQFPPEKVLNLQRKLADLAGVVVDETT